MPFARLARRARRSEGHGLGDRRISRIFRVLRVRAEKVPAEQAQGEGHAANLCNCQHHSLMQLQSCLRLKFVTRLRWQRVVVACVAAPAVAHRHPVSVHAGVQHVQQQQHVHAHAACRCWAHVHLHAHAGRRCPCRGLCRRASSCYRGLGARGMPCYVPRGRVRACSVQQVFTSTKLVGVM